MQVLTLAENLDLTALGTQVTLEDFQNNVAGVIAEDRKVKGYQTGSRGATQLANQVKLIIRASDLTSAIAVTFEIHVKHTVEKGGTSEEQWSPICAVDGTGAMAIRSRTTQLPAGMMYDVPQLSEGLRVLVQGTGTVDVFLVTGLIQ